MIKRVGIIAVLTFMTTTTLTLTVTYPFDVFGTHISKPISYLEKDEYLSDEIIHVKGWIEYNGEPASDVLVQIALEKERNKLISDNVTSNVNGNFSANLDISNDIEPGNYTVSVTSLCKEIHSNVCTYQWEELPITIRTS
jgi:hypothetical protein